MLCGSTACINETRRWLNLIQKHVWVIESELLIWVWNLYAEAYYTWCVGKGYQKQPSTASNFKKEKKDNGWDPNKIIYIMFIG